MPPGRPPTTNTGHAGPRVRVSPETLARLRALATRDETMPMVVARVVADAYKRARADAYARKSTTQEKP